MPRIGSELRRVDAFGELGEKSVEGKPYIPFGQQIENKSTT